jgi:hypothetical protein
MSSFVECFQNGPVPSCTDRAMRALALDVILRLTSGGLSKSEICMKIALLVDAICAGFGILDKNDCSNLADLLICAEYAETARFRLVEALELQRVHSLIKYEDRQRLWRLIAKAA